MRIFAFTRAALPATLALWLVATLMIASVVSGIALAQTTQGPLDMVLIIDTSKTMRGAGGAANIFPRVQDVSRGFLSDLRLEDTFTLIAFDSDSRVEPTVLLASEDERQKLSDKITALRPEGDWTYTADALLNGLAEADRLAKQYPTHTQVVLILTDGLNDPPKGARASAPSLKAVTEPYAGRPWYVYQVQLGPEVDEALSKALKSFTNGITIHDRGGANLDALRKQIQERRPPSNPVELRLEPDKLKIKVREIGKSESQIAKLILPEGLPAGALSVTIADPSAFPMDIDITPEIVALLDGAVSLRVNATARSKTANGTHSGALRLEAAPVQGIALAPTEVPLDIETSLIPPLWPKILAAILAAAVLASVVFFAIKRLRERCLDGQLEYWPQGRPQERKSISDLRPFKGRAVLGSTQIPLSAELVGAATLTPRKVAGQYHVVVTAAEGKNLTTGGRRQTEIVLYDRDTFLLEGWEFHYRGAVGVRPRA